MSEEQQHNWVAVVKPQARWRRWLRVLGIPKCEDADDGSEWYSLVLMDGALIAHHPIHGDEQGGLGRIETGVHLDRRTLAAALLRGHLDVTVQHHVWGAAKPASPAAQPSQPEPTCDCQRWDCPECQAAATAQTDSAVQPSQPEEPSA